MFYLLVSPIVNNAGLKTKSYRDQAKVAQDYCQVSLCLPPSMIIRIFSSKLIKPEISRSNILRIRYVQKMPRILLETWDLGCTKEALLSVLVCPNLWERDNRSSKKHNRLSNLRTRSQSVHLLNSAYKSHHRMPANTHEHYINPRRKRQAPSCRSVAAEPA